MNGGSRRRSHSPPGRVDHDVLSADHTHVKADVVDGIRAAAEEHQVPRGQDGLRESMSTWCRTGLARPGGVTRPPRRRRPARVPNSRSRLPASRRPTRMACRSATAPTTPPWHTRCHPNPFRPSRRGRRRHRSGPTPELRQHITGGVVQRLKKQLDVQPGQRATGRQNAGVRGRPACPRHFGSGQLPAMANSLHEPGTPLSVYSPRSSNSIPEPATRSFTVPETSTSPDPRDSPLARRYERPNLRDRPPSPRIHRYGSRHVPPSRPP